MSAKMSKDMQVNYQVYVANLSAKGEPPATFDVWINDYVQALKEQLRDAFKKADELDGMKADPKYRYGDAFPINRAAIECRNAEIDELRRGIAALAGPALYSVLNERARQETKWGEQNHDPYTYLSILLEEVGEYSQACLQTQFGGNKGGFSRMREEAVQVAAVALAIVECLDRGKWSFPPPPKIEGK